ncbi:hypothetical protein EV191_12740 [Tamaricihabitans halophyticus]|uniref:Uncharacterized protein n=1 Tax=Tamaricihabitans halophyticus TaxID=1262583 RepID=A0A4R2PY22_9PSEU|nr:hypothetical protein [Tamaricihabitans halophyticus]TCP41142.1 hypothetical protein EV191_12740 [Tamaricihabitans halophyticus]
MAELAAWAKARPPDRTAERERLHERTRRDRADYLVGRFQPHDCANCAQRVLVHKTSLRHTSIQWSAEAVSGCPELAERTEHTVAGCVALTASIEQAVSSGEIDVANGSSP